MSLRLGLAKLQREVREQEMESEAGMGVAMLRPSRHDKVSGPYSK